MDEFSRSFFDPSDVGDFAFGEYRPSTRKAKINYHESESEYSESSESEEEYVYQPFDYSSIRKPIVKEPTLQSGSSNSWATARVPVDKKDVKPDAFDYSDLRYALNEFKDELPHEEEESDCCNDDCYSDAAVLATIVNSDRLTANHV